MIRHSKPNIKRADLVGVLENLISDNIADGSMVRDFERAFCEYAGQRNGSAVALGSGMDALFLGLKALGVGPGDEIILPSYLPVAPLYAILNTGAKPVLADIGPDYNLSAQSARGLITDKTKAIIIAHLFGLPANLDEFLDLGVPLIEDCAQALGAKFQGDLVGGFGKFSFFSFYATKMITTGYGGMLLSRDTRLINAVRGMRSYFGKDDLEPVYSSNLTDFQAAMGINQLKRLPRFIEQRRQIAEVYTNKFLQAHLEVPQKFEGRDSVWYRYPLRVKRSLKDALEFAKKNTIEVKQPIEKPLHQRLELDPADFPETERAFLKTLSIPIYPALLNKEVDYIAKVVARMV